MKYKTFSLSLMFRVVLLIAATLALPHFLDLGQAAGLSVAAAVVGVNNRGRFINFISGISGVASGGNAVINLPVNIRYHRILLNVTDNGAAAAVGTVLTSIKLLVNGVTIRDITPANIVKVNQCGGYTPLLGELPINFTEPLPTGGTYNEPSDITSWDMAGQSTFQIQLTLGTGLTNPTVSGVYEFDELRNTGPDGQPFLQIVNQHQFSIPLASGRNDIVTLPSSYPLRRLFLSLSTGTLSELDIFQDGNKVMEASNTQLRQMYRQYGFKFAQTDFTPFLTASGTAAFGVSSAMEAITYFDGAYIADADARPWKALQIRNNLIVRATVSAAATLTIIQESLPGSFAS